MTPTAKPLASPVADLIGGEGDKGAEFQPYVRETRQPLTIERFRKLLGERGFQDLGPDETGDPTGRAWAEFGSIDRIGHQEGWKLAHRAPEEVAGLADRVFDLLGAGWKKIHVVTDHGWLLVPGGLPKTKISQYLVDSPWTRCATLRPGSDPGLPTVPWHWNHDTAEIGRAHV